MSKAKKKRATNPLAEPAAPEEAPAKIDEALERFKEADQKVELGVCLLNDAPAFFDGLDEMQRSRATKAIALYLEKARFALTSLVDEVQLLRGLPKAETKKTPLTVAPVADATAKEPLPTITVPELIKTREHLSVALVTVAQHEVQVQQSKGYVDACEYLSGQIKAINRALLAAGHEDA